MMFEQNSNINREIIKETDLSRQEKGSMNMKIIYLKVSSLKSRKKKNEKK